MSLGMAGSVVFIYPLMAKSGELPWPCYWGITLAPRVLKWGYTMALDIYNGKILHV
jgi:hypothetical protein